MEGNFIVFQPVCSRKRLKFCFWGKVRNASRKTIEMLVFINVRDFFSLERKIEKKLILNRKIRPKLGVLQKKMKETKFIELTFFSI